ncbi:MAG: helix-turn-helix domain-containing protein [Planctomycetaceae bacterium]|nr:helix-turn-helix domain-containing protein [Planctomycetaceae bacterium]
MPEQSRIINKDEKGRPLAEDGYPMSGLATIAEVVSASSLSRSKVYQYLDSGLIPSVRFGRSRRVQWSTVREMFIAPA